MLFLSLILFYFILIGVEGVGEVNWEGVKYYDTLINYLLELNIEPYITLYHWDMPQALEDSMGGWLSPDIV